MYRKKCMDKDLRQINRWIDARELVFAIVIRRAI